MLFGYRSFYQYRLEGWGSSQLITLIPPLVLCERQNKQGRGKRQLSELMCRFRRAQWAVIMPDSMLYYSVWRGLLGRFHSVWEIDCPFNVDRRWALLKSSHQPALLPTTISKAPSPPGSVPREDVSIVTPTEAISCCLALPELVCASLLPSQSSLKLLKHYIY